LENAKDPVVDKVQGLLLIAAIEQMCRIPDAWGGMQEVENLDGRDLGQDALAGFPERFLPIHQQHNRLASFRLTPRHFLRQPVKGYLRGRYLLAVLLVRQTRPEAFMLWHRTLGWQRVVIWAAKQRCHDLFRRTDKGINRVHRAHHRHLLAVGFGLLLRIMALDRGFRGRSPYRNPLPIGTHHAQGAFLLGLGSRA